MRVSTHIINGFFTEFRVGSANRPQQLALLHSSTRIAPWASRSPIGPLGGSAHPGTAPLLFGLLSRTNLHFFGGVPGESIAPLFHKRRRSQPSDETDQ